MSPGSAEFDQADPLRPVDWRWQRAVALHRTGTRLRRRRADPQIREAVAYLRAEKAAVTGRRNARLKARYSSILGALDLARSTTKRSIIEAGILSGEPLAATGQRIGVSQDVVRAFESLLFNVRDRLEARGWIRVAAIGLSGSGLDAAGRRIRLLKQLAFRGGPVVLNFAQPSLGFETPTHMPADLADESLEAGFIRRRVELLEILEDPGLDLAVLAEIVGFPELSQAVVIEHQVAGLTSQLVTDQLPECRGSAVPEPQDGTEPVPVTESADAA